MKQVFDSRFLIESYYSQDEKTKQKIRQKIIEFDETQNAIIPSIVILETIQVVCSREGKARAETIYRSIMESGIKIQNLTPSIAKEAGILKSLYRHVPVGDCIIAATAIKNQAKVLSDDLHFDAIKEIKRIWL